MVNLDMSVKIYTLLILYHGNSCDKYLILRTGRLRRFLSQERDDIPIISTCLEYLKHDNEKDGADTSLELNGT